MKTKNLFLIIVVLCAAFFLYSTSHTAVKQRRKDVGLNYRLDILPLPPEAAKILACGFNGIAADFLILEIGSLVGSRQKITHEHYKKIALAFEQAMTLDPWFQQTYFCVQGILPWSSQANMPKKTISLLKTAADHRPWDWQPAYYMGFDYYYFLHNYAKASDVFLETARIQDAPLLLAALGGRFAVKGERSGAAISLLQSMLKETNLNENDKKTIEKRVEALKGIHALEKAIDIYKNTYHKNPETLATLLLEGMINKLPVNPYAETYFYDSKTGRVMFDQIGKGK